MRISSIPGPSTILEFDREELTTLNNALNEVSNGIDLRGESETRMGTTREKAQALLGVLHSLVSKLEN
jgi:hypothetical protein